MQINGKLIAGLLALACITVAPGVQAQEWPGKRPIRLIVGFPPGGTTDIVARILAQKLTAPLGTSVVVENKAGAGGTIGADMVAKSPPDGHTFLIGNSGSLSVAPSMYPNLPYNPAKDFAPITLVSDVTIVLAVNPNVPAKTARELVALAKSKPGAMKVAIASVGAIHHLLIEQWKKEFGLDMINVPYKGSAPAVTDLISGVVDIDLDNLPALHPFIKAGRVRAIAVASPTRSELAPDIPTTAEGGMPNIVASPWFAMLAPVGTPKQIVDRMNLEMVAILKSGDYKEKLQQQGANPLWSSPEECAKIIGEEIVRWNKVAKESGAKLE